jgi:hypothetical protein
MSPTATKKSWTRALFVVLGVVAVAIVANPDKSRHDEVIRNRVADNHPIASLIGAGRLTSMMAQYHSIGVASYTTLDNQVATVGAFGIVVAR